MRRALVLAALLAGCSREAEPPAAPAAAPAPIAVPAAAPAPAARDYPDPAAGLGRLEGILAEARALGAPYELAFELEDFAGKFEHHLKTLSRPLPPHAAGEAGLPEPEVVDFEPGEQGARARWGAPGAWSYGDYLPRDGSQVPQGWLRVYGSRGHVAGDVMILESGVPVSKWRRAVWQAGKGRWASFSEADERAVLSALAAGPYARLAPDHRRSAVFECQRLQKAVDKARAAGRDHAGYQRVMKSAVLRAFDDDVRLEAARYLLEQPL